MEGNKNILRDRSLTIHLIYFKTLAISPTELNGATDKKQHENDEKGKRW